MKISLFINKSLMIVYYICFYNTNYTKSIHIPLINLLINSYHSLNIFSFVGKILSLTFYEFANIITLWLAVIFKCEFL